MGISLLFIGYLSSKVDFYIISSAIRRIDLYLYLLSTLLAVISNLLVAGKYFILIKESSISHSLLSLIKINFITRFYALLLPSTVGREAVRWYKVTRNQEGRAFFLATIIFERLTFLFVLILLGTIPLFFYKSIPGIAALRMQLMPWLLLALSIIFFLISLYFFAPMKLFFKSIACRILAPIWREVDVALFFENFSLKNMRTPSYIYIIGLCLVWQFFFVSRLFILIKAAALPLNFVDVAWMGSLVLVLQTIPISYAGIGIREGAYAYLFTLFHLAPELGVLMGILFFSQMFIMALLGGILELIEK